MINLFGLLRTLKQFRTSPFRAGAKKYEIACYYLVTSIACLTRLPVFVVLTIVSCASENLDDSTRPPNMILFLVDDLGWQDTSVPFHADTTQFNRIYRTPNMERLASEGMQFTSAYAACVCSPTRISLMTGMNAARHRVTNWTLRKDKKSDGRDTLIETPDWNFNGLSTTDGINNTVAATTLPQILQDHGYFTIHLGKAHFSAIGTPCADPVNCGFDVNVAGHAAGAPGSYSGLTNFGNNADGLPTNVWSVPGLEQYHGKDIQLTGALTLEAKAIMDTVRQQEQPFFLYMAHYAVHTPIQEDPRFFRAYLDQGLDTIEARYASMIEGMDKSLGDLMDYLEENDLSDNTIILFMSDNGGLSAVARGGEPHNHNAPLRSGKGSAYEGGVRVPMWVKWPEKIEAGTASEWPLIVEDFFPSILEMAGIQEYELIQQIDGVSFVDLFTSSSQQPDNRPIFWHYPNIWGPNGPGIGAYSAVRSRDWKLIYFHRDRTFELYDLQSDLGETTNLADTQPEIRKELAVLLAEYLREVGAQMPIQMETGRDVPWPDDL